MERFERAVEYKHNGRNCCQAVLLAYKDIIDLREDELLKIGAGFGVGFGSMEATCGALIGANIILGLLSDGKPSLMMKSKDMLYEFNNMCGATICKDLKGRNTGIVLCPCDDCVRNAVKILDSKIGN
ncbi:MAG: C_GCAxxG_C_C family protein [Acholeplasmatales bacterium]|nr:C_GCAxxG_C_C family protein [Acholeplasmatales bacterium]